MLELHCGFWGDCLIRYCSWWHDGPVHLQLAHCETTSQWTGEMTPQSLSEPPGGTFGGGCLRREQSGSYRQEALEALMCVHVSARRVGPAAGVEEALAVRQG